MLILSNATDKVQLTTSTAATVNVVASYADHTIATDNVEANRQLTAITTATTTDVVAAPGAGVTRNVKEMTVRNTHASLACVVTAIYDANATDYTLFTATIQPGEGLEYVEGIGWYVIAAVAAKMRTLKLGSNATNSTITATEVTGLTQLTGVGTFDFRYKIITTTSVTTTTPKFAVNHTGTLTEINYWLYTVTANPLAADGVVDGDVSLTTGGLFNVNAARVKGTTTSLTPFVSHDATTQVLYVIEGICVVTVDGSLALWHGSETANLTTVLAGSSLVLIRTD